jgi:hypothetical protein
MMQGGSEEETTSSPDATDEAAGEAVREGAKRLKGMLGF